jgi:Ca-activated chloride channel family protein
VRYKTQDSRLKMQDSRCGSKLSHSIFLYLVSYILPLVFCVLFIAWVNPLADRTKAGNRLYNKELYDEAMTKYTEVLVDSPNSPYIHFNMGNAAYKKEDYEEAIKSYTRTASTASDAVLEGKAYYNLGNCKYRQGKLKENTNLGEAISLYREALDYYKQALDRTPGDTNAKYNHEFVERKMKELLDKQKQQSGEQQEQQKQQSQQEQSEKDDKGESQDENEGQNAAQAAQAEQQEAQEGQKEDQGSEQRQGLTPEEARMLLDSLKDEELSQLQTRQDRRQFPEVLKDW